MSARNTTQVQGVHLQPVECADETAVLEAALDGIRRRPVQARKPDGTMVVCCSRTARKHGWAIEGRLFSTTKAAPEPKAPKASARLEKLNKIQNKEVAEMLG